MKVFDFNPGSTKPFLHLAHANGFLPPTYRESLEPLFPHYHVVSIPARPLWGDTSPEWLKSWSQMADDLIRGLEEMKVSQVVGVGHSLGGVLTLYAAVKRPDLFSRVILIDPTMLEPKFLWQIRIMKIFGFEARSFLIKGALRRRREWPSPREAYDYFRGRQLFKNWSDEMVKTYTDCIIEPTAQGGVCLAYPPEWEARIYKTIPTDVWRLAKLLRQPTLVLRGERSNTFLAAGEKVFRQLNPKVSFETVSGAG
ncbi:MAG TPA: alpha/beta hydrolase, partial [Puia sp.]|nr:alpha/beta hydrolase [Puia sp.]